MFKAKIKRGMKVLDAAFPEGWKDRINQETLDLGDNCQCVLGQLFDHYKRGMDQLKLTVDPKEADYWDRLNTDGDAYGFSLSQNTMAWMRKNFSSRQSTWNRLTSEWVQELQRG